MNFYYQRYISNFLRIGGSIPVTWSYYAEFQPKAKRGSMLSFLAAFWMVCNLTVNYKFNIFCFNFTNFNFTGRKFFSCRISVGSDTSYFPLRVCKFWIQLLETFYSSLWDSKFNCGNYPDIFPRITSLLAYERRWRRGIGSVSPYIYF